MATFPPHLAASATAEGLRLSPFEWIENDLPGREAASGTAVVGDYDRLEAFLDRFVAARIGADGHVRALLAKPDPGTVESVLYFPGYYLDGERDLT
jgi:hypothetical protein